MVNLQFFMMAILVLAVVLLKRKFMRINCLALSITTATYITIMRLILILPIEYCIIMKSYLLAAVLFCIAAVTDFLDGFIARRYNQESKLGAVLDPIADKLLLLISFGLFTTVLPPLIPFWFFVILLVKEFCLIAGFGILYISHSAMNIRPTFLGKCATCMQLIFIISLLFIQQFDTINELKTMYGKIVFFIVGINILAFIQYYNQGLRLLFNKTTNQ
jgi:cardiolipin synthase